MSNNSCSDKTPRFLLSDNLHPGRGETDNTQVNNKQDDIRKERCHEGTNTGNGIGTKGRVCKRGSPGDTQAVTS